MLTELTANQLKVLETTKNYWVDLSWRYQDLSWEKLQLHYKWLYSLIKKPCPIVVVLKSPMELQIAANLISQVRSQVESQVESQVRSQVGSQVESQVWSQVESQVGSQVWSQVESQVWSQVESQVRSQVGSQKLQYFSCWESQLSSDSGWISFYDTFSQLDIVKNSNFDKYKDLLIAGPWMTILCENIVFVCSAPSKVSKRLDGIIHNENAAAYEFSNGEKYYVLNSVSVPEWLVLTHSDALDPKKVLNIKNADQRAEGIRKLGIERLCKYGKVLDTYKNYNQEWFTKSKYELIDMAPIFKTISYAPYLKMENQSVPGVWHVEAVSKECKTLQDAINFRTKSKNPKIQVIK